MSLKIDTSGSIIIDGADTHLCVKQTGRGTIVYTREMCRRQALVDDRVVWVGPTKYAEHIMPHRRYLLGFDGPANPGVGTRAQFEADVRVLLARIK